MHPLAFQLKRAHQRVVSFGQAMLRSFGLTPARFDLLFIVHERPNYAPTQTDLCRILGVTAATISKMVRSLEELGIVERFKCFDRRLNYVALSTKGLALVREVMDEVFGSEALEKKFESAFGTPSIYMDLLVAKVVVEVEKISRTFGDTSTLDYYDIWEHW